MIVEISVVPAIPAILEGKKAASSCDVTRGVRDVTDVVAKFPAACAGTVRNFMLPARTRMHKSPQIRLQDKTNGVIFCVVTYIFRALLKALFQ